MDNQKIFEKLKTIVISINSNAKINENSALIGESILDSLEFINYITKVEESFGISISDSEITDRQFGIINKMITYINSKT